VLAGRQFEDRGFVGGGFDRCLLVRVELRGEVGFVVCARSRRRTGVGWCAVGLLAFAAMLLRLRFRWCGGDLTGRGDPYRLLVASSGSISVESKTRARRSRSASASGAILKIARPTVFSLISAVHRSQTAFVVATSRRFAMSAQGMNICSSRPSR
jgi:hypothetical protein